MAQKSKKTGKRLAVISDVHATLGILDLPSRRFSVYSAVDGAEVSVAAVPTLRSAS